MDFSLLRKLVEAPGVSGLEASVRSIFEEHLKGLGAEVEVDPLGNCLARISGDGPRVLLDAHMDEVGLLISHIDDAGFLRFVTVGGIDPRVLYGQCVTVWGVEPLPGVIGAAPPHLSGKDGDKGERVIPVDELFIDLGLPKEEVLSKVSVGDPVTFFSGWHENNHSIHGKALDDRVGLFIMLSTIKEISGLDCDLYLLASAQEEIGLRGAGPAARRVKPDIVLTLEGTVANDVPSTPPHKVLCRVGAGPEIRLCDGRFMADRQLSEFIVALARGDGIPCQVVVKRVGGTNAATLQTEALGARTAVLSVPVRYIHGPVGIAAKSDIEAAVAILVNFLYNIDKFVA